MPKARPTVAAFTGFARSAPAFFHELAIEMNRDWFVENKARYDEEWVQPMTALLTDVGARIAAAYKPRRLGAPKVMRIYRDVRFSKDKTPYKTHIGAVLTVEGKRVGEGGNAALYVHLGMEDEVIGSGMYFFDAPQLVRWRKAVAGKGGAELVKLIGKLRAAGYQVGGHDDYKKVPKGFDPDHPRAELLKYRGLTATPGPIPRGLIHKAGFADWLVERGKAMAPLVSWLEANVG